MIEEKTFLNQQNQKQEKKQNRTKEEAQQELIEKFGLRKTSDFQLALQQGKIELAEAWLDYIVGNKENFPQYKATWDSWLEDRRRELLDAKNLNKT